MRLPIGLVIAVVTVASYPAQAQTFEAYEGAILACDNLHACTLFGLEQANGTPRVFLKISRGAGPDSAPMVSLGGLAEEYDPGDRPIRLAFEGQSSGRPEPIMVFQDGSWSEVASVPAERHSVFFAGLRNAKRLEITIRQEGGQEKVASIPLFEMRQALARMDRVQGRAGTVTSIAEPGRKAAAAVPQAPRAPVVSVATGPEDIMPPPPPDVLRNHLCDEARQSELGRPATELNAIVEFAARLAPDRTLWGLRCGTGAYNTSTTLAVGRDGGPVETITLEVPPPMDDYVDGDAIINGFYSPEDMTLTSFAKSRGVGDCGSVAEWAWDGQRFRLIQVDAMPLCRGIFPDNWPGLWRVEVRRVGDN